MGYLVPYDVPHEGVFITLFIAPMMSLFKGVFITLMMSLFEGVFIGVNKRVFKGSFQGVIFLSRRGYVIPARTYAAYVSREWNVPHEGGVRDVTLLPHQSDVMTPFVTLSASPFLTPSSPCFMLPSTTKRKGEKWDDEEVLSL